MKWGSSRDIHTLSLRGKNGVTEAAIHRVTNYPNDLSLRLLVPRGSPRAFNPRDDKVGEGRPRDDNTLLSLRENSCAKVKSFYSEPKSIFINLDT